MKFKKTFTCDVCRREITYPDFRIEWGYNTLPSPGNQKTYEFIQVCHDSCSYGVINGNNHPITMGDIIFSQFPYTPESTDDRLDDLSLRNPSLKSKITQIKNNIFE